MQSLDLQNFKTINTILSRDSKDTTYKYALLRGAVEIALEYCCRAPLRSSALLPHFSSSRIYILAKFEGRLMPPFSLSRFIKTSPNLKHENGDRIEFPLGLLAGKWLLY